MSDLAPAVALDQHDVADGSWKARHADIPVADVDRRILGDVPRGGGKGAAAIGCVDDRLPVEACRRSGGRNRHDEQVRREEIARLERQAFLASHIQRQVPVSVVLGD